MIFKDYYKILGLESNKVSLDEIRNAFREQAKKYHPDINSGRSAEERFKDINEAYRVLSEHSSRKKYDRIWYSHVGKKIDRQKQKEEREARPDLLTMLFGSIRTKKENREMKKAPQRGENVETEISVNVEQAYFGTNKNISLRTVEGKMKSFSVKIPEGIRNGEKIRLIGQGKQGINGGKNGDLLIKINIENTKRYRLQGYDIYTNLYLTPSEATLGTKVKIDTIDDSVNIFVPQGVQSGEKIRIAQKGYKDGKGGRGDLVADIKISVPKKPTEEEIEIYKKLAEISKFKPRSEDLT